MASPKSDLLDITSIKINPAGETINECEQDKQAVEKQQNVNKKSVAARPWRMMGICVGLICVAAFILVNEAWIFFLYFPPRVTQTRLSSSKHEDLSSDTSLLEERSPLDSTEDGAKQTETVQFVPRHEWKPEWKPFNTLTDQSLPVSYVIVSQTSSNICSSFAECSFQVRFIQNAQVERGWDDIVYNFLIGGDGRVYIGRDWNKVGNHTNGYNSRSIGVAFIGRYDKIPPSKRQLNALQALIKVGLKLGKLTPDYKLLAYDRQISISPNSGDALYDAIKMFPHWSSEL